MEKYENWTIFIRDLKLNAFIGVYPEEYKNKQEIIINVACAYNAPRPKENTPYLENVVCYHHIADKIKELVNKQHITLVEILAQKIADICLEDIRIICVTVKIEKTQTPIGAGVGVEIKRQR